MSKEEFPFFVFQLRDDDQNGMVVANFVNSNGQWFTLTIYGNFLGFWNLIFPPIVSLDIFRIKMSLKKIK